MELEEEILRRSLTLSDGCGETLLDAIENGVVVVITMRDGRKLTLADRHMARRTLRDVFGWRFPSPDTAMPIGMGAWSAA